MGAGVVGAAVSRFSLVDSIFSAVEKRLGFAFLVRGWQAAGCRSSTLGWTPESGKLLWQGLPSVLVAGVILPSLVLRRVDSRIYYKAGGARAGGLRCASVRLGPAHSAVRNYTAPSAMGLLTDAPSHASLLAEADSLSGIHLRDLLQAPDRPLTASFGGVVLDYSRQKVTPATLQLLEKLYDEQGVAASMAASQIGAMNNPTEERSVLHTALRASRDQKIQDKDGHDVVPDVYAVLDRIKSFSEEIRGGVRLGSTGKVLTNVVVIGIGGSYLGPEFVCEALRFHEPSAEASWIAGRTLRFLANVDPTDVFRATADLDPEETLVVIISKTFTTAETMLNASTVKKWLVDSLGEDAVPLHMVACSSALDKTAAFGIADENVFGFWDWVGGRVSVSCSVGALPMALHFGYGAVEEFHTGLREVDEVSKNDAFCI